MAFSTPVKVLQEERNIRQTHNRVRFLTFITNMLTSWKNTGRQLNWLTRLKRRFSGYLATNVRQEEHSTGQHGRGTRHGHLRDMVDDIEFTRDE